MKLHPSDQYRTPREQRGVIKVAAAKAEHGNWARSMSGGELAVNTKYFRDIYGAINAIRSTQREMGPYKL